MFSILNNFVFADDNDGVFISPSVITDAGFDANGQIVGYSGRNVYAYNVTPGHTYKMVFYSSFGGFNYGFSSQAPEMGSYVDVQGVLSQDTEFVATDSYLYIVLYTPATNYGKFGLYDLTSGYDSAISGLFYNVNGSLIWDSFVSSLPFILVCTTFGLGTVFIHRLIKSGSKGKAKLF